MNYTVDLEPTCCGGVVTFSVNIFWTAFFFGIGLELASRRGQQDVDLVTVLEIRLRRDGE